MRGWLRRLGCWERVGEDDGCEELPETVAREIENAASAYENVHGEMPQRQVIEVEYDGSLYRARFRRRGDGVSKSFYRAPAASAPARLGIAVRRTVGGFTETVGRVREDPSVLRTRKTVFSAFAFVLVAAFVAGVAGFGVVGSSPAENGTNATPGNVTSEDIVDGSFVLNEVRTERLIVERTDSVRREHGVGGVRRVADLSRAATEHAGNMAENEYVGHVTPEGDGVGDRYLGSCDPEESGGYTEQRYSENAAAVAFGEPLGGWNGTELEDEEEVADFVVEAWMGSKDHRENLLGEEHDGVGVGVRFRDGKVFVVQAFC